LRESARRVRRCDHYDRGDCHPAENTAPVQRSRPHYRPNPHLLRRHRSKIAQPPQHRRQQSRCLMDSQHLPATVAWTSTDAQYRQSPFRNSCNFCYRSCVAKVNAIAHKPA
jgi:hypothetical protein